MVVHFNYQRIIILELKAQSGALGWWRMYFYSLLLSSKLFAKLKARGRAVH
jgi:hypothetical protein